MRIRTLIVLCLGCTGDKQGGLPIDEDSPPSSFIGSPCILDTDCNYPEARCLKDQEGFPGGTCTTPCEEFCPDAEGFPTTFCVDRDSLPIDRDSLPMVGEAAGMCVQRCDFAVYPFVGCRNDYGCVLVNRNHDPDAEVYACIPGQSILTPCMQELADRGVPFSSTVILDASPEEAPELTCHVDEPIIFHSGYLGIELVLSEGNETRSLRGDCTMGHALANTLEGLQIEGVVTFRHLGGYSCRPIAGTKILSRHARGDAIDIYGFDFDDGTRLTLVDNWEHDTTSFKSVEARQLYELANGWHKDLTWTVILT
ncbi:MAG: extensin family protein, partial [Myxococcales bacterium]|nr:extensin family protein [Myxococcales bacterium]